MSKLVKVAPNLYREEPSGIYIVRKSMKGKSKLWQSTGETSLKAAKAKVDGIVSRWMGDQPKTNRKLFGPVFDMALAIKKTKRRKTHKSAVDQIDGHLRPWFDKHCPFIDQFNAATWDQYILDQQTMDPGRALKHDRELLNFVLNLAHKKGLLKEVFKLRKPDPEKDTGRYFEEKEVKALLKAASNPELRLQILMAVKQGMRLTEILHLSWDRVDFKSGLILLEVIGTKNKRKRWVPIHNDVMPLLRARQKEIGNKSMYAFPAPRNFNRPVNTNQRSWTRARRIAKVRGRFHDLKHTAVTDMIAGGIPGADVSKIAGVSEAVIKKVYHHIRPEVLDRMKNLNCGKFVGKKSK